MHDDTAPLPSQHRHPIGDYPTVQTAAPALPPTTETPTPTPGPAVEQQRRGSLRRAGELSLVALLAAGLASGGTYAATTLVADEPGIPSSSSTLPAVSTVPVSQAQKSAPDWQAVAATVAPSVVSITVRGEQGQGQGSGVVIDEQGHVLTNNHVVSGGGTGTELDVTLANGDTYAATVAGTDPSTDLAVLSITEPPDDLTPILLGSSDSLAVGDPVMAIGNPLGLSGTVTTGIVSALDRPVTAREQSSDPFAQGQGDEASVTNAVQTSAAINPGNSGGALVDAAGRLVGINSSIASLGGGSSGSIGIGFAIPVDTARMIADQLIADGTAEHAFLGVTPQDGTATLGSARRSGAKIAAVSEGSAAAKGGLQQGDVVVAVSGTPVVSAESLVAHIREQAVGSTVELTIVRDGKEQQVDVTLGQRPQDG